MSKPLRAKQRKMEKQRTWVGRFQRSVIIRFDLEPIAHLHTTSNVALHLVGRDASVKSTSMDRGTKVGFVGADTSEEFSLVFLVTKQNESNVQLVQLTDHCEQLTVGLALQSEDWYSDDVVRLRTL